KLNKILLLTQCRGGNVNGLQIKEVSGPNTIWNCIHRQIKKGSRAALYRNDLKSHSFLNKKRRLKPHGGTILNPTDYIPITRQEFLPGLSHPYQSLYASPTKSV